MDAIGNTTPPIVRQAAAPAPKAAPQLPAAPAETVLPDTNTTVAAEQSVDIQAAEKKRLEAVEKAARQIANTFVISDRTFSIFKDTTGQYITRFTSLRDGKVTYIPEPELLRSNHSTGDGQMLNITA